MLLLIGFNELFCLNSFRLSKLLDAVRFMLLLNTLFLLDDFNRWDGLRVVLVLELFIGGINDDVFEFKFVLKLFTNNEAVELFASELGESGSWF